MENIIKRLKRGDKFSFTSTVNKGPLAMLEYDELFGLYKVYVCDYNEILKVETKEYFGVAVFYKSTSFFDIEKNFLNKWLEITIKFKEIIFEDDYKTI